MNKFYTILFLLLISHFGFSQIRTTSCPEAALSMTLNGDLCEGSPVTVTLLSQITNNDDGGTGGGGTGGGGTGGGGTGGGGTGGGDLGGGGGDPCIICDGATTNQSFRTTTLASSTFVDFSFTYTWYSRKPGETYTEIPGETGPNYTTTVTEATYFKLVITYPECSDIILQKFVDIKPRVNYWVDYVDVCPQQDLNQTTTLRVHSSDSNVNYDWYYTENGSTPRAVGSGESVNIYYRDFSSSKDYYVVANGLDYCETIKDVQVFFIDEPNVRVMSSFPSQICKTASSIDLRPHFSPTGGQFYMDGNLVNFPLNIVNAFKGEHIIKYVYTTPDACSTTMDVQTTFEITELTIDDYPEYERCLEAPVVLKAPSGFEKYYWYSDKSNFLGSSSSNQFEPSELGYQIAQYYYMAENNGCLTNRASGSIKHLVDIWDSPTIIDQLKICEDDVDITLHAKDVYDNYIWKVEGVTQSEMSNSLSVPLLSGEIKEVEVKGKLGAGCFTESTTVFVENLGANCTNFRKTTTLTSHTNDAGEIFTMDASEKDVTYEYFDGLGQVVQKVNWKGSPNEKDMVMSSYFNNGLLKKQYLPYESVEDNGFFKEESELNDFYASKYPSEPLNTYFSELVYNNSSDHKTSLKYFPGSWANQRGDGLQQDGGTATEEPNHDLKYEYSFNGSSEVTALRIVNDKLVVNGSYNVSELNKTISFDEIDNQIHSFENSLGENILKRVQADDGLWADTYYVYDNFGNLRFVLPPEASSRMATEYVGKTETEQQNFLNRWAFLYKYDGRNRMIEKKVPGADWVYMVYDKRDRLVLTQDGNQCDGKNEWTFTKYDDLNRPVLTGIVDKGAATLSEIRDEVANITVFSEGKGTVVHGYTNNAYPQVSDESQYLTVTYYDDYEFLNNVEWQDKNYEFSNPDEITSVQTDGTNQYIALHQYYDTPQSIGSITLEAWVKTDFSGGSWNSNWAIIDFDRSEYYDFYVRGDDGRVGFSTMASNVDDFYSQQSVNDGQWHHLAAVFDGVNKRIYIDGVLDSEINNPHNGEKLGSGTVRYGFIGDGSEATSFDGNRNRVYFQGEIGEVRLWDTVRTAYEIYEYRDVPLTGNETGLVGMWTMDDRFTTLVDQTGNGNDGEFRNMDESAYQDEIVTNGMSLNKFDRVKGQVTGAKVKTTDGHWVNSVTYYDDKYRPIQTSSSNILGGVDRNTTYYDFVGNFLKTITYHSNATNANKITRRFEYDHAGRLLRTYHQVNAGDEVLLSENVYNELGELIDKKLHSEDDGTTFAQSVDYRYNIRGWLTKINDSDLSDGEGDYFGMELGYNEDLGAGNTPLYNGNISAVKWSANFAGDQRLYNYQYDVMERLTAADYKANKGTGWAEDIGRFDMSATFDLNGNLQQLTRYNGNPDPMDDLHYTYDGNNLLYIDDLGDHNKGFLEGNAYTDDFTYDANGNLIKDRNKNLMDTDYTHNNLVSRVESKDGSYVKYIYDANAIKLAEEEYTADDELKKRTEYIGPFTYIDGQLKYINHKEGQILFDNNGVKEYNYDLKDYLGNVRIRFTTKKEIDTLKVTFEEDHYLEEVPEVRNYTRISNDLFDHTDAGTDYVYSQMLTGANNSIVGLAKEISVIQGDTIRADVYAKYFNPTNTDSDVAAFLAGSIAGAFGVPPATSGEASALGAINNLFGPGSFFGSGDNWTSGDAPRAYLNAIVFDKDYNVVNLAFDQIDVSAEQPVGDPTKYPHDQLSLELIIDQPGYVYLYVSNETPKLVEVYFDDLEIRYHRSPIIQQDDYYPYGMSIAETAIQKDNPFYEGSSFANRFGFKDLGFRRYDPASGRFFSPDPLAELQFSESPYQYAGNNPARNIDELGLKKNDKKPKKVKPKKQKIKKILFNIGRFFSKLFGRQGYGTFKGNNSGSKKGAGRGGKKKNNSEGSSSSSQEEGSSSSENSDQDNPDENKFKDFSFDFDKTGYSSVGEERNTQNNDNLLGRKHSRQYFTRIKETETEQQKAQRKASLTEQLNEKYRKNLQRNNQEIFASIARQGGYDMAVILQRLNSNADLSEKVVKDQPDQAGSGDRAFGVASVVEGIKAGIDLNQSSIDIKNELIMVEDQYDFPVFISPPRAGRLNLDGKIIDVEIKKKIGGLILEANSTVTLDVNSVAVTETNFRFYKSGSFVTYTFDINVDGEVRQLEISVKKEDAYDFEEYMGLEHSIDNMLNEPGPFSVEKIREARELIEEMDDEAAKGDAFEKLQYKVKNKNQRELENLNRESMCQLTVLSQCLELKGVKNPSNSKKFPDYLEDKRVEKKLAHRTNSSVWKSLIKDFNLDIKYVEGGVLTKDQIISRFKPYIENGDGVMLSIRYKDPITTTEVIDGVSITKVNTGGHIIRLVGFTENGIIVDDPYGKENPLKRYNYSETTESYWIERNKEKGETQGVSDAGHHNLWKWEDISNSKITYGIIIKNK